MNINTSNYLFKIFSFSLKLVNFFLYLTKSLSSQLISDSYFKENILNNYQTILKQLLNYLSVIVSSNFIAVKSLFISFT